MRTKTLITSAVLGMAGAAALQAQVYSVNAVGYINVEVVPGFNLIANQLNASDNTIPSLLAGVPEGTSVYKFDPASGYSIYTLDFGDWGAGNTVELTPGDGFWIRNPGAEPFVVTFVGEVPQGTLNVDLVEGFNLVSSMVPQAGAVTTDLGLPADEGNAVYVFSPETGYGISAVDFGAWSPSEPTVGVGEGFWVRVAAGNAGTWTRDFSVN
jgi:hypothetical protein